MLRVGFYEKVITPPLGCDIPGFFLPRVANDVLTDLYARAVVVENEKEKIAMLALDVVGVNKQVTDKIIDRIHEYAQIKKESILICSTHLHTGGPVSSDTFLHADDAYVEMMIRLSADAVTLAAKRMKLVTAKYACGMVDSISYVRNFNMAGGYVMTNPERGRSDILGPCADIDPDVPVLMFFDQAQKPCGAIISFACHQDCLCGEKRAYSTDFAGVLDKELKKEYGPEFVSVFFEGACGNINHHNVRAEKPITLEHHRKMGRILAAEIKSIIPDAEAVVGDAVAACKQDITLKRRLFSQKQLEDARAYLQECEGKEIVYTEFNPESAFMRFHYAHRALDYMKDDSSTYTVALMAIRIGDVIFSAFPGEVFVQFGKQVKSGTPTKKLFVVELAFDNCGYIPTSDLFQPTVYESTLPTCIFEPDAGGILADTLIKMNRELL